MLVAYRELRLLEFEVLKYLQDNGQLEMLEVASKVHINQFYGIDVEDFSVEVAHLSLILVKHQIDQLVSEYFARNVVEFPVRENAHLIKANALEVDWRTLTPDGHFDFIFGNPPFVGFTLMTDEQTEELGELKPEVPSSKKMDYVAGWFYKAAQYMSYVPRAKTAFVATNSISQGISVINLWRYLFEKYGVSIDFAYQTFKWSNEAHYNAKVFCVIIGYSIGNNNRLKPLTNSMGKTRLVKNINAYLVSGSNIIINTSSKPKFNVSRMIYGNMPRDGGNLIIRKYEREELLSKYPEIEKWIKPYWGAEEYVNGIDRWVLWLRDVEPYELQPYPELIRKITAVHDFRIKSKALSTRKAAETPTLFVQLVQPRQGHYIFVPRTTSGRRFYLPVGFVDSHEVIASDNAFMVLDATLFEFGILTSWPHMAWMRAVCGRLKGDYRYSNTIAYNNFIWPEVNEKQRILIEHTAKKILDERAKYPNLTMANLYDDMNLMPYDLKKAHRENDSVVMEAYQANWNTEEDCVEDLLQRYENMTS